jgi:hypothetical protein
MTLYNMSFSSITRCIHCCHIVPRSVSRSQNWLLRSPLLDSDIMSANWNCSSTDCCGPTESVSRLLMSVMSDRNAATLCIPAPETDCHVIWLPKILYLPQPDWLWVFRACLRAHIHLSHINLRPSIQTMSSTDGNGNVMTRYRTPETVPWM